MCQARNRCPRSVPADAQECYGSGVTTTELGDFTAQAQAYRRARPTYPPSLVAAVAACVGARAGDRVADIGAGTGIFTEQLAGLGFRVSAIEPNAAMRGL